MKKPSFSIRMSSAIIVALLMFVLTAPFFGVASVIFLLGGLALPFTKLPVGILGTGGAGAGEEEKSDEQKLIEKIKSEIDSILDGKITTTLDRLKHLEERLEELKEGEEEDEDGKKSQKQINHELALEISNISGTLKAMRERGSLQPEGNKDLSVEGQIKAWLKNEDNKKKYEDWVENGDGKIEIELIVSRKAAGTMTNATNLNSSAYLPMVEMLPGVNDVVRNKPFVRDFVNVSGTNSAAIVWVDKVNPEGQADFLGEGGVKPLVDFELKTTTSKAKKIADKIKISTEMLDDIPFIAGEIDGELRYLVDIEEDNKLFNGDGTGDDPRGIADYAGLFVIATIETTTPNNSDAIRAAIAQIASLNFAANFAFVNPLDAANMDLQKGTDGQYVLPPFTTSDGRIIAGVRVVETNQIPVGNVLVADTSVYKVRDYKPFVITMGWVNDDFEKNLVTIIGEKRIHAFMSDNNTGALVYDTFDNIKTAITTI